MLTLMGPKHRYCDGVDRRSFLKIGGLAMGGLSLSQILHAEQQTGIRQSHKSVIMVYLSGGLAHQDTFDLKPNAPQEVRGEFKPIQTNVPGIDVGELLPKTAAVMDRIAILRSIVGMIDEHSSAQNLTGYPLGLSQREGKPNFGSVIARVLGPTDPRVAPFVDLFPVMQHRPYNSLGAGVLGRQHGPVTVRGDDLAVMQLKEVSVRHFSDRRRLLASVDQFRRDIDNVQTQGMDSMYQRAFDVLSSSALVKALDVEQEPPALRERYGRGSPNHLGDGAPMWNDQLLMARRLVEAGVRCVTVAYGFWDTHGNNFAALRDRLPAFDQGISALVADLYDRGLDKDVTLLVWGEFGRTPKINKDAGRDHWAPVNSALFSGGGMKTGQVIGSTDSRAAYALDRPIHFHDVLATVYQNLGISPNMFVPDVSGRPTPVLPSEAQPIAELG
ncbi:MAG: DUF1501 domain-containing protein [Planctomycetota bacterium]